MQLEAKCRALAEQYSLSQREKEVAFYLAQGKHAPEIKDMLFISVNTVRNHVRHIYEKLDIHSRKEFEQLLDAVSEFD